MYSAEGPVHYSAVALIDPVTKYGKEEDGRKNIERCVLLFVLSSHSHILQKTNESCHAVSREWRESAYCKKEWSIVAETG
jgi:hypothetical protein